MFGVSKFFFVFLDANMFVSGSQDKTARIWDLRTGNSVSVIPSQAPGI